MNIAIVGSEGFFGSNLVRSWHSSQNELLPFNRKNTIWDPQGNFAKSFETCQVIIWAATSINPIISEMRPDLVSRELTAWKRFLQQIASTNSTQKILLLSSGGCVYSNQDLPFREDSEARGINKYGQFKVAQERLLGETLQNFTIARVSNLYGKGQPRGRGQGVIAEWSYAVKNRMPIKIFGNLENSRDFLHVLDAVSAIEKLAESQTSGIFNVGSGTPTTLTEILELMKISSSYAIDIETYPHREVDRREYYLSIEKITEAIAWIPKININEGVTNIMKSNEN
jgi:UDP-glucose 4-epimerase